MKKNVIFYLCTIIFVFIFSLCLLNYSYAEENNSNNITDTKAITSEEKNNNTYNANNYEMRGVWIATVNNINMPPMKEAEFTKWADDITTKISNLGFNTIVFQVRPAGDALYKSNLVPWSSYITGISQGSNPNYDPLQILLKIAHSKGLEFHAWINPYRITTSNLTLDKLSPNNIAIEKPEWIFKYGKSYYLNPGIPEVSDYLTNVILEIVDNYDIDAIHIDDYFYPSKVKGIAYTDDEQFKKYGANFNNIEDWRRNNITNFLENLNKKIKEHKYWVQLGVSPSGVWQNSSSDETGSNTKASAESYNSVFADTRSWIQKNIVDYITPQIYWSTKFELANFNTLAKWWSDEISNRSNKNINLYLGLADYKVKNNSDKQWYDPNEILSQIKISKDTDNIKGTIHYSIASVLDNNLDYMTNIKNTLYKDKALTPQTPWNNPETPKAPNNVILNKKDNSVEIKISTDDNLTRKFVIYRIKKDLQPTYDKADIVSILYNDNNSALFIDNNVLQNNSYTYLIKSISYTGVESTNIIKKSIDF